MSSEQSGQLRRSLDCAITDPFMMLTTEEFLDHFRRQRGFWKLVNINPNQECLISVPPMAYLASNIKNSAIT